MSRSDGLPGATREVENPIAGEEEHKEAFEVGKELTREVSKLNRVEVQELPTAAVAEPASTGNEESAKSAVGKWSLCKSEVGVASVSKKQVVESSAQDGVESIDK